MKENTENDGLLKRQTVIEYLKDIGIDTEKVLPPTKVTEPNQNT